MKMQLQKGKTQSAWSIDIRNRNHSKVTGDSESLKKAPKWKEGDKGEIVSQYSQSTDWLPCQLRSVRVKCQCKWVRRRNERQKDTRLSQVNFSPPPQSDCQVVVVLLFTQHKIHNHSEKDSQSPSHEFDLNQSAAAKNKETAANVLFINWLHPLPHTHTLAHLSPIRLPSSSSSTTLTSKTHNQMTDKLSFARLFGWISIVAVVAD